MLMKPFGTAIMFSLLLAAAPVRAETGVTPTQITIGQSAAMTGANAKLGNSVRAGAQAYFDRINRMGGVYGRKITMVSMDDAYDPGRAIANTKRLIEEEKVFALFGYVGTPTSLAAVPLFTSANVPFIAPFSGGERLRVPFNHNIFNIRASYFDETKEIINFLNQTQTSKIAVFYQNDSYGENGLEGAERALATTGKKMVATAFVERNSTDVSRAVETIAAANPGGVVMICGYKAAAEFVREIRKVRPGVQLWNVSFVGTQELSEELGDAGRGVAITQVMPTPVKDTSPLMTEYLQSFPKNSSYTSLEGYIDAKVFVEGLRKTGPNLTREGLIKALENDGTIDMGGYLVKFSPSNHNGSSFVNTVMISRNGKIVQ